MGRKEKNLIQRVLIFFMIVMLPMFFVKEYRIIKAKTGSKVLPTEDFKTSQFCEGECKKFTFIVLVKNNVESIEENYVSIVQQKYPHYRIVYLDQGSSDGSVERLKGLMKTPVQPRSGAVTLFECQKGHEVFRKYYEVVQGCEDDEVIIHLYATDWLAHDEVLKQLNRSYSNPDVWLTYGQYLDYPKYKKGIYEPYPKKNIYKKRPQRAPWVIAPLKTFYAALLKRVHHEPSYFLSIKNENSLLLPLAEMGKSHVRFIPDVLFIHNRQPSSAPEGHKLAVRLGNTLHTTCSSPNEAQVDLLIVSRSEPARLQHCIESSLLRLEGVGAIHVVYECDEATFVAYEELKQRFPSAHFVRYSSSEGNFKSFLLSTLFEYSTSYVLLSTDEVMFKHPVSLDSCIAAMRKTQAYGFYMHLGKSTVKSRSNDGIYMWNSKSIQGGWQEPDSLKMALYRRLDLEKELKQLSFNSVDSLIESWGAQMTAHRIGLSFDTAKVVSSTVSDRS